MTEEYEFEIVWNGGPLLPPRNQRPDSTWTAPVGRNRSKYQQQNPQVDAPVQEKTDGRSAN